MTYDPTDEQITRGDIVGHERNAKGEVVRGGFVSAEHPYSPEAQASIERMMERLEVAHDTSFRHTLTEARRQAE